VSTTRLIIIYNLYAVNNNLIINFCLFKIHINIQKKTYVFILNYAKLYYVNFHILIYHL